MFLACQHPHSTPAPGSDAPSWHAHSLQPGVSARPAAYRTTGPGQMEMQTEPEANRFHPPPKHHARWTCGDGSHRIPMGGGGQGETPVLTCGQIMNGTVLRGWIGQWEKEPSQLPIWASPESNTQAASCLSWAPSVLMVMLRVRGCPRRMSGKVSP